MSLFEFEKYGKICFIIEINSWIVQQNNIDITKFEIIVNFFILFFLSILILFEEFLEKFRLFLDIKLLKETHLLNIILEKLISFIIELFPVLSIKEAARIILSSTNGLNSKYLLLL